MSLEKDSYYRNPIQHVADMLKAAFVSMGFQLLDNGEFREVEAADDTYPTWTEPKSHFAWASDPIRLVDNGLVMRTRLLPGCAVHVVPGSQPLKLAAFGRVFHRDDPVIPVHRQIELLVIDEDFSYDCWKDLMAGPGAAAFGIDFEAGLSKVSRGCWKFQVTIDGKTFDIGFCGPATSATLKAFGARKKGHVFGWVMVIDVDDVAAQYFGASRKALYSNVVTDLRRCGSAMPAFGGSSANRASNILRRMGYLETCSNPFLPEGIYKKMNMIQETWDTNNAGYQLTEQVGGMTSLRTVLVPGGEEALAQNFRAGERDVRIFEVSHIFSVDKTNVLPIERFAVSMCAYSPQMDFREFTEEVREFLESVGVCDAAFVPTEKAIAYRGDECLLVLDRGMNYLDGNFGHINPIALENFGIETNAYTAQLELDPLVTAARKIAPTSKE